MHLPANTAPEQQTVRWDIRPFIAGSTRDPHSSQSTAYRAPGSGKYLYDRPDGSPEDVNAAVAAARAAFESRHWSGLGPSTRKQILHRYCDLIARDADQLALYEALEMGKPITQARSDVRNLALGFARYYAESVDKIYGQTALSDDPCFSFTLLEPWGVVGAIIPWNFPTLNATSKLFPALAAGNSIVLKPSELASASALHLATLAVEAGIPEGVVNVVPGLGLSVGAALAQHPDVDFLSFTGSTATGHELMRLCAISNGKPLMIECGGKSPGVVFGDMAMDLDALAVELVNEAMWNQGQVCVARSRVLVEASIRPELQERVVAEAARRMPEDPLQPGTTFGPLAGTAHANKVRELIASGEAQGAELLHAGTAQTSGECYVAPVVFGGVTQDMRVWREEIFGPVLTLTEFNDVEHALSLARDTHYGLSSTVWTRNMVTARKMVRGIRAAEVVVRAGVVAAEGSGFALPAEPRGASGFGAEAGIDGLKSYMAVKKVDFIG